jgi:hypothetical protein
MAKSTRLGKPSSTSAGLAVAGALMVLIGAQMPALEIQWLGALSYREIGGSSGTVLMAAAIGALVAVVLQSRSGLGLSALALWGGLLWPLLRAGYEQVVPPERSALDELGDALGQAVGDALRDEVLRIIGVRAGVFVLLAGCVLVSLGALRRGTR